jgi:hypothetical protein
MVTIYIIYQKMVSEKLIIALITVAMILSVISVVFTLSSLSNIKLVQPEIKQHEVVIPTHDSGSAQVGLGLAAPPEGATK